MKRKIKFLSMVAAILVFISGCAMNAGAKIYDNEKKIAKNYDTYNLVHSKQQVDKNCLSGSADCMEGMGTIWKLDADEPTDVKMSYKIKVSSGKAKLVLISPDSTLTTLAEFTAKSDSKQEKSDTFQVKTGKNRIKLVGAKDTKIEFEISADKGKITNFND